MAGEKSVRLFLLGDNRDAKAKIDEIDARAEELKHLHPELSIGVDTAAAAERLKILRDDIRRTANDVNTLKKDLAEVDAAKIGSSALWFSGLAAAAGPALPILGLAATATAGLGASLVSAGAGLGLFALVAKSAFSQVSTATAQYSAAMNTTGKARTTALAKYQAELAALTPEQQAFAKSITGVQGAWQGFVQSNQSGVSNVMAGAFRLLPPLLKELQPLLPPTEKALNGIISVLGKGLQSNGFTAFIHSLSTNAGPAITKLAGIFGHLFSMLGKGVEAFQPQGQAILSWLDKILGKADAGTNNGLAKFFQYMQKEGPPALQIIKNIGSIVGNLSKAFFGLGSIDISAFVQITNMLAKIASTKAGATLLVIGLALIKIGPGIIAMVKLVTVIKDLAAVINIAKFALIALDAVPIVLFIAGIVAVVVILITHWNTVKKVAGEVWHYILVAVKAVFNWVKSNWPLLLGILLGPIALAAGEIIQHWKQVSHFASVCVDDIVNFFKTLPGKIIGLFKDAGSWLLSAGKAIVDGAVRGIENGFGDVTNVIGKLAGLIPSGFKKILSIFSPSRVMTQLATMVPAGIVAGLEGGTSQVQTASNKLASAVKTAFTGGLISQDRYSSLTDYINRDTNQLKTLANERLAIQNKIKAADAYAAQVSATASSSASLATIGGNLGNISGNGLLGGMSQALQGIRQFSADVTRLRKAGLSGNLIDQIIQMGPVDGDKYAQAILSTGAGGIKQFNGLQTQISQASSNLGAAAANAMYDSGKNAGKGFLTGLSSQEKAITAEMSKIGNTMVATIKRDLGIHSPSRVFDAIGVNIVDGLTGSLNREGQRAARASQAMISVVANPKVSIKAGQLAASNTNTLQIEWVGGQADQEFMTWLKKNVRIRNGDPSVLGR